VTVAASTAWEILKNAGIDSAPRCTWTGWSQFLRSQADAILACGFCTADLLDGTQAYALAVIEHGTRRIRILGFTQHPAVLADAGICTVLCSIRTPRMNAITERWTGGCPRELLDRTLIWNQAHLRLILREYETHTISTSRTAPCTAPRH
jgi:putative transposase